MRFWQNSRGSSRKEVQGTLFNLHDKMSSDTEEKMKLFYLSYFIATHERPFSEDLCKLRTKNDLSLGETYINDKGCRVFVEAIDGVMKEDESKQVNKQCFISVMTDSGTDTSKKDHEIVYVSFLENGLPVNKYVADLNSKMHMLIVRSLLLILVWLNLAWKIGKVKQLLLEVIALLYI